MTKSTPTPSHARAVLAERIAVRIPEVQALIGCSRDHVYSLINSGVLTRVHLGGAARITVDSLLRALEGEG